MLTIFLHMNILFITTEIDDVDFKLKDNSKSNHDYDEVPAELSLSGM